MSAIKNGLAVVAVGISLAAAIALWKLLPKEWWDDGTAQGVTLLVCLPVLIINQRITWDAFGALTLLSLAIGAVGGLVALDAQLLVIAGSAVMLSATWWLADRRPSDAPLQA